MAGLLVDLVKVGFLGLKRRRKELDRTGDQRELQITFPIGAGSHVGPS
jgi:hypothetical protein